MKIKYKLKWIGGNAYENKIVGTYFNDTNDNIKTNL